MAKDVGRDYGRVMDGCAVVQCGVCVTDKGKGLGDRIRRKGIGDRSWNVGAEFNG